MTTNFFYVYAIKDPQSNQPKPFYVGKGTGSRAYDHLVSPDSTRKYKRINLNPAVTPYLEAPEAA